ncbi:DNA polymerase IV [Rhodococcus sp. MEB064]|uniref:DNA polymerase IV n=1 Tax=Rhodococcus sp. MEB064 TaxID=1587522 RepID=UPI0005AC454C|nr:DNA polymerase IV [Rhodococcus sp. MEB064]KIQ19497.1 DNA polymerase IV [Rhodococcus sp. MEB064]
MTAERARERVGEATILHADLDSFYSSVEQRDDPSLRGRPVIVGGGVVLAASYEAKAYGVKTAMGGRQARALCPQAVVVPPRMGAYSQASKDVFAVFENVTPLVEGISIDEAFLDVTGLARLSGSPSDIARDLRRTVAEDVGLPITVGVARTKFLAKIASAVAKPDGLLEVPPDRELEFLHPLPVERMWGVGRVTADKLHAQGIRTIGELAAHHPGALASVLGTAAGSHLHALSHGIDARRVSTGRSRRSVGAQHALGRRHKDPADIDAALVALVDRVTYRMRKGDRAGRTVTLRLRFDDFTRATRSTTLTRATADTHLILTAARSLLAASMSTITMQGLTLVGVAVSNLEDGAAHQLELPFGPVEDEHPTIDRTALDNALDGVHRKFGSSAVTRGVLLGREERPSVPMLHDQ